MPIGRGVRVFLEKKNTTRANFWLMGIGVKAPTGIAKVPTLPNVRLSAQCTTAKVPTLPNVRLFAQCTTDTRTLHNDRGVSRGVTDWLRMQALRFLGGNTSSVGGGPRTDLEDGGRASFTLKFGLASTVQRGTSLDPSPPFCTIHRSQGPRRSFPCLAAASSCPSPLTMRTCRCGRQLDMFGHHRAACAEAGVLGKRGVPLQCAAAQICGKQEQESETWTSESSTLWTFMARRWYHLSRPSRRPPTTTELRGKSTRNCRAKVARLVAEVGGRLLPRSFVRSLRRNRHHISSKTGWRPKGGLVYPSPPPPFEPPFKYADETTRLWFKLVQPF